MILHGSCPVQGGPQREHFRPPFEKGGEDQGQSPWSSPRRVQTLQRGAQIKVSPAFSKGGRVQGQRLWSRPAGREIPLRRAVPHQSLQTRRNTKVSRQARRGVSAFAAQAANSAGPAPINPLIHIRN